MRALPKVIFSFLLFSLLILVFMTLQDRGSSPLLSVGKSSNGLKIASQLKVVENSRPLVKLITFSKNLSVASNKKNVVSDGGIRSDSNEDRLLITLNHQIYNMETLTDDEAKNIARWITKEQLQSIRNVVLTSKESTERRNAHLLFLIKMGTVGSQSLYEVFKSDIPQFQYQDNPHSGDSYKQTTEHSLRITAIEALDQLATTDSASATYIQKLNEEMSISKSSGGSTMLGFLASISYSGIISKQPGKLHRVLEAMIKESSRL